MLTAPHSFSDTPPTLNSVLEPIRVKHHLPALAGAIFTTDGLAEQAAVGVRKAGTSVAVTTGDLWHLGSDSKAMTATLAGTFVAEKKLSWDVKVISFFPEIANQVSETTKGITLGQVLTHEAGLVEGLDWSALSQKGSVPEQRVAVAHLALITPAYPPGTFHYANTDYIVVAAILEKISGKPWEDLIRERLFQPLGMTSCGFGGLGTVGQIDQPWPHQASGVPMPSNGPEIDNVPLLGPAGRIHCTMNDWAKFLSDQLRGEAGLKALLPGDIYKAMHTASATYPVGYGWGVVARPWAGGNALSHAGSNTMNYCVCWLAPAKKFGVLVCTNQGGDEAAKACDEASAAMIQRHEGVPLAKPPTPQ